ncbi:MAG TPA: hypothetical protein VGI74_26560 [Streptosporangiaceae bacterium]
MLLLHTLSQLSASAHPGLLAHLPGHVSAAAANVPNPAPLSPAAGGAITTLIAWVKWLALVACGASAVMAGGMIAIGSTTQRTGLAERGKTALLWSVIGAVVVSIGIPLVNRAFSIG